MKLCYITRSLPFGKGEAFVIPEIVYALDAGNQVSIVPLGPADQMVHADGAALLRHVIKRPLFDGTIAVGAIVEIIRNPFVFASMLYKIGKSRSFEVLIKNLAVLPKAFWLAAYFRRTGLPDHIHAHWINATATLAMITASLLKVPWSITSHRADISANNLVKEKVESCSFVRCINENGAREIRSICGDSDKIKILHLGVAIPDRVEDVSVIQQKNGTFKILMPANFVAVKGHTYLVQAMKILRSRGEIIQLDLAGEGNLKPTIQQQVEQLGLDGCVNFLGELSHSRLLEQLFSRYWDCVTLPSIHTEQGDKEGIPVSLMEAMAAGIPVVSTNTGGIPELCIKGTALLVPEKNPQALAEAIALLIHDSSVRENLARQGKIHVAQHFNIKAVGPLLLEEFRRSTIPVFNKE